MNWSVRDKARVGIDEMADEENKKARRRCEVGSVIPAHAIDLWWEPPYHVRTRSAR